MRTIKFRGKSVVDKKWVYGSFVLCTHNAIADICDIVADNNDMTQTPVLSYTVGQFVGLHDDNDREIYEGDIVHIKRQGVNKDFGIVKWNTNGYFFIDDTFSNKEKDANPIGNFFESIRMSRDDIEITVNGNIHDRPILLKQHQDTLDAIRGILTLKKKEV